MTARLRRDVVVPVAIVLAVITILVVGTIIRDAARAGAQVVPPQPAPITDYAGYPANNGLPAGCDANGVLGVTFTVNGGAPVANLQDIGPLKAGDVLAMTWTDVLPVCDPPDVDPGPIVLAMKSAPGPFFDPTVDQALDLPYALGWLVGGQGGSISYVLPDLLDDTFAGCFGQLDAIVGLPLQVVGPGGSFYNFGTGWDMLISAWNGGYEPCEPPTTTTSTVPETTTSTSTTVPETTTTQPTTTTSTPVPSTVPEVPEDTTPTCAPSPQVDGPSLGAAAAACVLSGDTAVESGESGAATAALPASTLPRTGAHTGTLVLLGTALILIGLMALAVRQRAVRS